MAKTPKTSETPKSPIETANTELNTSSNPQMEEMMDIVTSDDDDNSGTEEMSFGDNETPGDKTHSSDTEELNPTLQSETAPGEVNKAAQASESDKPAATEATSKESSDEVSESETTSETPEADKPETQQTSPKSGGQDFQKQFTEWRGNAEKLLSEHHYNLSEDLVQELQLEPEKTIPKLMSKVYLDAVTAAMAQIVQHLPQLVRTINDQDQNMSAAERKFFEKWPMLQPHKDAVIRIAQTYRAHNPSATTDQFMNEVGAQAVVALGLLPQVAGASQSQQQAPQPFKPAGTSPAPVMPNGNARPTNPFDRLASEFEEDMS